ncbi:hypothetical protein DFH09DRAFT_1373670 [Mycena vulgaris]|nr:hypothetical protein DFH09DRAFT_1373670 [Mycena vulgaris]
MHARRGPAGRAGLEPRGGPGGCGVAVLIVIFVDHRRSTVWKTRRVYVGLCRRRRLPGGVGEQRHGSRKRRARKACTRKRGIFRSMALCEYRLYPAYNVYIEWTVLYCRNRLPDDDLSFNP